MRVPTACLEDASVDPLSEMSGRADELRYLMRADRSGVHKLHVAVGNGASRVRSAR
ncbi:hypothetical protein [Amycolatopsis rubida]|uniref:Uncharacterized protein n=1 Tax=Amycolatopsis rubida TaxID=112413 RepID=A0A1I6A429_9PSEU|nr:hypothetical protein [Amycolatopsis rubida]SFQ63484.1 hypothetical protein SAMN05421854_11789 [Amycolatopsis rubida]